MANAGGLLPIDTLVGYLQTTFPDYAGIAGLGGMITKAAFRPSTSSIVSMVLTVLYGISAVLGLIAVLVAGPGTGIRIVCIVVAFAISLTVWLFVFSKAHVHPDHLHPVHREGPAAAPAASSGAHAAPSAGTESREKQEHVG